MKLRYEYIQGVSIILIILNICSKEYRDALIEKNKKFFQYYFLHSINFLVNENFLEILQNLSISLIF